MSAEFCDTNILVYAYDPAAGPRHVKARHLVRRLWENHQGALSIQVLQELFVTLTRKVAHPLTSADARQIVADFSQWHVVSPSVEDILAAIDGASRWQVSFWDAMILVTAAKSGAAVVWSEDLSDGQQYGSVVVRNPFADWPS